MIFQLQELQDFLHDLTEWEHVVKEKEKKLVDSGSKVSETNLHLGYVGVYCFTW